MIKFIFTLLLFIFFFFNIKVFLFATLLIKIGCEGVGGIVIKDLSDTTHLPESATVVFYSSKTTF